MAEKISEAKPSEPTPVVSEGKVLDVDLDDEQLHSMGYEQHMKRGFNFWSMTVFCLTGLGLLPSLGGKDISLSDIVGNSSLTTSTQGTIWFSMGYLGLLPMTWGWLVASFLIMTMVFSLAELSSAYPTAGGL